MNHPKQISARLKGTRGETIAEVLIALLISSMGMLMLAGMIFASGRIITKSRESMESYIAAENDLSARDGAESGTISFSISGDVSSLTDNQNNNVTYFKKEVGNKTIISYKGE